MAAEDQVVNSDRSNEFLKSLKDLEQLRYQADLRVQNDESSREFYLSLWKASPFVFVPLFTSTLIAIIVYGDIGWFFVVAPVSVFLIGFYSWQTTKSLDGELAENREKAERSRKALARRIALVESELLKLHPSTHQLYIDSLTFDERMDYVEWRSVAEQINPHLLIDMIHAEGGLVEVIKDLDTNGSQFTTDIKDFWTKATSMVVEVDTANKVDLKIQPKSRLPAIVKGMYYIMSGTVNSAEEATRRSKELGIQNEVAHHLRLLFEPSGSDNPHHELMQDPTLKAVAKRAEKHRLAALGNEKSIRTAVQVLVGESESTHQIGVR